MTITVYSTTTCPYCKMLHDYLESKNISFVEKTIDTNEEAKKEMEVASGGFFGVPFTLIALDDGRRETVIGFDKGKLDQLLTQ